MYNQDYASAHETLNRVIAADPQNPLPYAFRASAHLFYELDRLGVLETEFLLDDKQIAEKKQKLVPDPQNREKFIRAVQDAESRAGGILKANPNDQNAIFAMCIAEGVDYGLHGVRPGKEADCRVYRWRSVPAATRKGCCRSTPSFTTHT